jgi:YggT family protein
VPGGGLDVVGIVRLLFWALQLIVLIRCVLSWLRTPSYTSRWLWFWNFIYAVTEPLLAPIRRAISRFSGGARLDFSPFVLVLLLSVVEQIIIRLIVRR